MNNSIFLDKNKLNDKSERSKLSLFFFGYKPTTQEKKLHRIKFLSMYNSGEKYEELLGIPNLYDRVKNKVKVFLSSSKYFLRNNKVKVFLLGYRPTKQEAAIDRLKFLIHYDDGNPSNYVSLNKPNIFVRLKNQINDILKKSNPTIEKKVAVDESDFLDLFIEMKNDQEKKNKEKNDEII